MTGERITTSDDDQAKPWRDVLLFTRSFFRSSAARNLGAPGLADLTGRPIERQMLGALFVSTILHYCVDPAAVPTEPATINTELLARSRAMYQTVNEFRDEHGRIPPDMIREITQNSPQDDPAIVAGRLLVQGLRENNLLAEPIAQDALLAIQLHHVLGQQESGAA